MSKVFGLTERYTPLRKETTRIVARYGKEQYDDKNSTWYEVYFNKNQYPVVTLQDIKTAIIADINSQTEEKILTGFVWQEKPVWLSSEYQFDFKAAYDLAVQTKGKNLPMRFKLGENTDGEPVYHTFDKLTEFTDFYTQLNTFVNQCRNEGWDRKDSIDWNVYDV